MPSSSLKNPVETARGVNATGATALVPKLNVNALSPVETEEAVENAGVVKTRLTDGHTFVSAMLAGALLLVLLVALAGTMGLADGAVGDLAVTAAVAKVASGWGTLFVRGILCSVLVCLAVRIGFAARISI